MSIPVGVHVHGAGSGTTTITTNKSKYIKLQTAVPSVDGSNEINGFNLTASTTNTNGILSSGRNNQKIHDMIFTNWSTIATADGGSALTVMGKYGYNDTNGAIWSDTCVGGEPSCTHCDNDWTLHVPPISTDWATGIEIYSNTFTNSKLTIHVLKGAKIHNNTIDNDNGTNVSGIGHTGFWFSGIEIYNNIINMNSISNTVIAMELWEMGEGSKVYNNTISGWTSFVHKGIGKGASTYALEIYGNTFYVSKDMQGSGQPNIEISNGVSDVAIYNNYFSSLANDRGCDYSIAIWGKSTMSNILIYGNVFGLQYYNTAREVIIINDAASTSDISNVYVYNNVFDSGPNKSAGLLYQDSTGVVKNTYWRNNIIINMYDDFVLSALSGWTGHTADHNYSYNCTNNYRDPRAAKWTKANNITTNSIVPGFIGVGAKPSPYYLLQSNSPCIGVGVVLGTPYNRPCGK
jgi:hypothetical protein